MKEDILRNVIQDLFIADFFFKFIVNIRDELSQILESIFDHASDES